MAASSWIPRAGWAALIGFGLLIGPWIHVALGVIAVYGLARAAWITARRHRPIPPSLLAVIVIAGVLNTGPDLLQAAISLSLCLIYAGVMPKEPVPCPAPD